MTFLWWPNGDLENSAPMQFDQHRSPCRIDVDDEGISGKVSCPKTSTQAGDKTVSIEFEWKAPQVSQMPTTTLPDIPPDTSTSSSTP